MSSLKFTIEIPVETSIVYRYLRNRYQSDAFQMACQATRGYVPSVTKIEDIQNERLCFRVAGRDTLLKFTVSSWSWSYDLTPTSEDRTKITIEYTWSWVLSMLSMWTAGHQASNELTETVLALEALHFERT